MSEENPNNTQEFGPVAGAVVIVLLVALGGAYFFFMQSNKFHQIPAPEGSSTILYQSTTTEE